MRSALSYLRIDHRIMNNEAAFAHNKYAKRINAFISYSLAHENFLREFFIANHYAYYYKRIRSYESYMFICFSRPKRHKHPTHYKT